MADGTGALGDYYPRRIIHAGPAQVRCEYCRRVGHSSGGSNCEGCGAALPIPKMQFVYNAGWVTDLQSVGPGVPIPIYPR